MACNSTPLVGIGTVPSPSITGTTRHADARLSAASGQGQATADAPGLPALLYEVTTEDEFLIFVDPQRPGEVRDSAAAVAHYLASRFSFPSDQGDGFDARDLAVWKGGRLVATVIQGPDGTPVVHVLDPSA